MTAAPSAYTAERVSVQRASFVQRSLLLLIACPLLALATIFLAPAWAVDTVLLLLATTAPWLFSTLAWRYGSRYARSARWAWQLLSVVLAVLGVAVLLGVWYLVQLAAGFARP